MRTRWRAILGCYPVIVPQEPGVLSALGFISSDIKNEFSQTFIRSSRRRRRTPCASPSRRSASRARDWLDGESVEAADQEVRYVLDMRYRRQGYEIPIEIDGAELPRSTSGAGAAVRRGAPTALRLRARRRRRDRESARRRRRPRPVPRSRRAPIGGADASAARTGTQPVWTARRRSTSRPTTAPRSRRAWRSTARRSSSSTTRRRSSCPVTAPSSTLDEPADRPEEASR